MPISEQWKRIAWIAGGALGATAATTLALMRTNDDLHGQVALITGGSRGLGLLLAQEFAKAGCKIAICARDSLELSYARSVLERQTPDVFTVECDVSSEQQVRRMVEAVHSRYGRIDILVNNAGSIVVGPVESMTPKDFESAMNVMFWGVLWPTMNVLPDMRRHRRGRIVNVTSIGGKVSVPHLIPYCCAKFAAVALSEGLHSELIKEGIYVTTVVPGLMRTGSHVNAFFKGKQEKEYAWFGTGAVLPALSISARRAARMIVHGVKSRAAEITLGAPADFLARFHGLFPAITAELMGWINQYLLPEMAEDGMHVTRGADLQARAGPLTRNMLWLLGRFAERPATTPP